MYLARQDRPGSWKESREEWARRALGLGCSNEPALLTALLFEDLEP